MRRTDQSALRSAETGAVLHAIHTRLDATQIAFPLDHAETMVLISDGEFDPVMAAAVNLAAGQPLIIDVDHREFMHHRGADLFCYSNVLAVGHCKQPVYLWTLSMFHCNGWCFPWTISAVAVTYACLRGVGAKAISDAIVQHGVSDLFGAPIVMSTLLAAAPPPETVLAAMALSRIPRDARVRADRGLCPCRCQRMARDLG